MTYDAKLNKKRFKWKQLWSCFICIIILAKAIRHQNNIIFHKSSDSTRPQIEVATFHQQFQSLQAAIRYRRTNVRRWEVWGTEVGSRGKAPLGVWGQSPPEAEAFC